MANKICRAIETNVGTEETPVSAFVPEDGRKIPEPIVMMPDSDGIRWFWDGPNPSAPDPLPLPPPADA